MRWATTHRTTPRSSQRSSPLRLRRPSGGCPRRRGLRLRLLPPAGPRPMTRSVFVSSPEGRTGKSAVGLGLFDLLARRVGSVGVFRPLVNGHQRDVLIDVLVSHPSSHQTYEEARGVTYEAALADPDEALATIVHRYGEISERHDFVLIMGSDFTDVSSPTEHTFNARVAANLGSPVVMVVSGVDRTPDEIMRSAGGAIDEFRRHHNDVVALIANRVAEGAVEETQRVLSTLPGLTVGVMPEHPLLTAPTIREQIVAAEATLVQGEDAWLDRESLGVVVAGMTLPNVLDRLFLDATVVTPERPHRAVGRSADGSPVRHVSHAGRDHPGRRLRDPGVDPAIVRRRRRRAPHRPHVLGHLPDRTEALRPARPAERRLDPQDRDGTTPLRRTGRPGGPAGRDQHPAVRHPYAFDVRVPADGAGARRQASHRAAGGDRRPDPRGRRCRAATRRGGGDPARRPLRDRGTSRRTRRRPDQGRGGVDRRPGAVGAVRGRVCPAAQPQGRQLSTRLARPCGTCPTSAR